MWLLKRDPKIADRKLMDEKEYLTLTDAFRKDGWIRIMQGWFVAFLLAILIACLAIVTRGFGFSKQTEFTPSQQLLSLRQELKSEREKKPTDTAKVLDLQIRTDALDKDEAKAAAAGDSEAQGWARTTITAIIGFITGFISARKVNNGDPGADSGATVGNGKKKPGESENPVAADPQAPPKPDEPKEPPNPVPA